MFRFESNVENARLDPIALHLGDHLLPQVRTMKRVSLCTSKYTYPMIYSVQDSRHAHHDGGLENG